MATLGVLSAALFALRIWAALRVGFGDSEALYACYALHPQPIYRDHPGLVGVAMGLVGGGTAPAPVAAHLVTAVLATAFPFVVYAAARLAGGRHGPATGAALGAAVTPELAVGLFGFTPDLLLAYAWTAGLAALAVAFRSDGNSPRATFAFLVAGLAAGAATVSKVSGGLLVAALLVTLASRVGRPHRRTVGPWAAVLLSGIIVAPVAWAEVRLGFPMLRHRVVHTQAAAGLSLRNAAALVGGQLAYVSPLLAVAGLFVGRDLLRRRGQPDAAAAGEGMSQTGARERGATGPEPPAQPSDGPHLSDGRDLSDGADVLLRRALVVCLAVLVPLCLWSAVAEPHWLAPAWLVVLLHYGRRAETPTPQPARLLRAAVAFGALASAAVYLWVLVPAGVALLPRDADPRYDLANELVGWPDAVHAAEQEIAAVCGDACEPGDLAVVGPHWVVCAQLEAGLARGATRAPVGCATPIPDDFDGWFPRAAWRRARAVLYVTDNRFPAAATELLPGHAVVRERDVVVARGGREARRFRLTLLSRRGAA